MVVDLSLLGRHGEVVWIACPLLLSLLAELFDTIHGGRAGRGGGGGGEGRRKRGEGGREERRRRKGEYKKSE